MRILGTLAIVSALALGACSEVNEVLASPLTDERLASDAAGVLGTSPSNLTVTERRVTNSGTYFSVRASNGRKYNCVMTGGGILALGLSNPPDCARDGQPIQRRALF